MGSPALACGFDVERENRAGNVSNGELRGSPFVQIAIHAVSGLNIIGPEARALSVCAFKKQMISAVAGNVNARIRISLLIPLRFVPYGSFSSIV